MLNTGSSIDHRLMSTPSGVDAVVSGSAIPVGAGDLDWKRIFTLVKAANIRNIVAEVGAYGASTLEGQPLEPPDYSVMELYKRSAEFLRAFSDV